MDLGLQGRVAVVTGAGGGIGSAIASALAEEGCRLVLIDCDCAKPELEGALVVNADVRDFGQAREVVRRVVTRFGGIDILVCSAGITRDGVSWKLSEADWDDVIAVNLKGCFNYTSAVTPALRQRGGGRIINIASINGMRGKFGQANYAASKAGVIGLTKTLAKELGRFDITVNAVAPGMTATAMTNSLGEEAKAAAVNETVFGRICLPQDIADAVVFLSSQRARHITGEVLRVDAGQYI